MQDSWPGVWGGGSRLSPISLTPYNQELDMKECRRSTSSSPVLLQTAFPDTHYFCWLLIDFFFFCFVIRGWGTDAAASGFPPGLAGCAGRGWTWWTLDPIGDSFMVLWFRFDWCWMSEILPLWPFISTRKSDTLTWTHVGVRGFHNCTFHADEWIL